MDNIFTGIKIIDCTRVFSWPYASRYFADYWAEVIKIESLENFDEARKFPPLIKWRSWYFEVLNRWKKSILLNLKNKKDLEKFYNLIKTADIFLENYSNNVKNKLKIDYKTLSKINPRLIYGSLNWYGKDIDKKAYDIILQAESWLASLNWETKPMKNATAIIDTISWTNLALAITSLLYKREKTWKWSFVNISMLASAIAFSENNLIETSITWKNPSFVWNHDNAIFPFWFFKTKNWEIAIAIWNDNSWKKFVENLIPELKWKYYSNKDRLENKEKLIDIIESIFTNYDSDTLIKKLDKFWIANWKIKTMNDILKDKTLYKNKTIQKWYSDEFWEYVVPYSFAEFSDYEIEKLRLSPKLWENEK